MKLKSQFKCQTEVELTIALKFDQGVVMSDNVKGINWPITVGYNGSKQIGHYISISGL